MPLDLPANADWLRPWRYGRWRGPLPDGDWPDSREAMGLRRPAPSTQAIRETQLDKRERDGAGV